MLSKIVKINFPVLLLSFTMAFVVWYMVVVNNQVDVQIEVQVEYMNMPKNLVVTDGLLDTIDVRLRGPHALLSDIPVESKVHMVDLSNLHKGRNSIPFVYLRNKSLRAFEVQEINPQRLVIIAEDVQERNVGIEAQIISPLQASKIKIADLKVEPSSVRVRGPSSTIENIKHIPLRVRIDPKAAHGPHTQVEFLDISQANVSVIPARVTVSYTVLSERKTIEIEKPISLEVPHPKDYSIEPPLLNLKVEIPEALANNKGYLTGLQLSVTPSALDVGESALVPLRVTLPEGMVLTQSLPKVITVTRKK